MLVCLFHILYVSYEYGISKLLKRISMLLLVSTYELSNSVFLQCSNQRKIRKISVLGEGTSLITNYLEQKYSITLSETADNPKALSEALGAALDGSMKVIQRRILRLLYERINLKFPSYMTIDFVERINEVRKAYNMIKHFQNLLRMCSTKESRRRRLPLFRQRCSLPKSCPHAPRQCFWR